MKKTPFAYFISKSIEQRTEALFRKDQFAIFKETDRMFAVLLLIQWIAGIIAALVISPKAWYGMESHTHIHVWAAIFLGGAISILPIILALTQPGTKPTRYVISVAQMLWSALLIHLTGGRIETHFHVFGSLAFLSFYRDWRVLIPATIVVALDHLIRGIVWPQSVYGVITASPLRFIEHVAWVVFEDIFLVIACFRNVRDMREKAFRAAELEAANATVEAKVEERTAELKETNEKLGQEIQERKKLHDAMLQSEKLAAVGRLAGGVAHEINNPLGIILGYSQGVVRQMKPGNNFEIPLKSIEREAVRCKRLVQDLLTFSRSTSGDKEEVNLNEAVEGALSLITAHGRVKQIEITKHLQKGDTRIIGNKNQVQQVVVNLCSNGIDAMPKGGKLTIRTRRTSVDSKPFVELLVEDTGCGIPEELKSKVFEPFFTTKEVGKGTGLGLSLVYEIMEKHKGKIFLESEVDKGTVFHALFPEVRKGPNGQHSNGK